MYKWEMKINGFLGGTELRFAVQTIKKERKKLTNLHKEVGADVEVCCQTAIWARVRSVLGGLLCTLKGCCAVSPVVLCFFCTRQLSMGTDFGKCSFSKCAQTGLPQHSGQWPWLLPAMTLLTVVGHHDGDLLQPFVTCGVMLFPAFFMHGHYDRWCF